MGRSYAKGDGYVIAEASAKEGSLNAEVWRHERLAQQQGLPLVVEIFVSSALPSRRLTEWWEAGGELARDTLDGIYLLRVDLKTFGPEAVLRLTPYAIAGAPLFVGWNPIGQVLSRSQFDELTRESMAQPLSAFVEDVLAGRPHTLNPRPTLGSAERNREAEALRKARTAFPRVSAESNPIPAAAEEPKASPVNEPASPTSVALLAAGDTAAATPAALDAGLAPTPASPSEPAPRDSNTPPRDGNTAHQPAVASPQSESPEDAAPEPNVVQLEQLLAAARSRFTDLEDLLGQPLRFSLEDLHLVDLAIDVLSDEERTTFARQYGAVLAVYLGDTIRNRVAADWQVDALAGSTSGALVLSAEVLGERMQARPIEWVIATLSDPTRSLFGQALGWCRIH